MRVCLMLCSLFLLALPSAFAQFDFPAPTNIQANPKPKQVDISWDAVPGALEYEVTIVGGEVIITNGEQVNFRDLTPVTTYTATVRALGNGTIGADGIVVFDTILGKVQNLRQNVDTSTASSIDVEWDMLDGVTHYEIELKDRETQLAVSGPTILPDTTTAYSFTGITSLKFFRVILKAFGPNGQEHTTGIRVRVDGFGIQGPIYWGLNMGGEAMIYRPLKVPRGPFKIELQLPCACQSIKFWNARIDHDLSDEFTGRFVLVQNRAWMKRKNVIGFNFLLNNETLCDFPTSTITVDYYNSPAPARAVSTFLPLPIKVMEWQSMAANLSAIVSPAGMIKFKLHKVFKNPNKGQDTTNMTMPDKPDVGMFVMVLNTGPGCSGGILPMRPWGMTLKDTTGMPGYLPNMMYFAQDPEQWYTNDSGAGFLYGFDPTLCPDRTGMTAQAVLDSDFVTQVYDSPDIMPPY